MHHLRIALFATTSMLFAPASLAATVTVPDTLPTTAPAWTLKTPAGKTVHFPEDAHGQPSVLLFWPSWCPYSRALQPYVQRIWEDYRGAGVHVWTINILETGDPVATMKKRGLSFPLLLDGDALRNSYHISRTPWLVVVDGDNRIVYTRPASPPSPIAVAKKVRETLNGLLGDKAVPLPTHYPAPYTLHLKKHSSKAVLPKPKAPPASVWQPWVRDYLAGIPDDANVPGIQPRGRLDTGKAAIRAARSIWGKRYGTQIVHDQAPHRAYRLGNRWVVLGTTANGKLGDGLILVITRDTGRVLKIADGKDTSQQ